MKRKIILTGSSGFLGGVLLKKLAHTYDFLVSNEMGLKDLPPHYSQSQTLLHMAGIGSVPDCEKNPMLAYETNTALVGFLAESFFKVNPKGHFILASTGQVYDENESGVYTEQSKLNPKNIYARTKLAAEEILKLVAHQYGGTYTILRLFNHTHKTQALQFFLPSVYHQIKTAPATSVVLKTGNLELTRDLSAVGDFVTAIDAVLKSNRQQSGIYNLSSGVGKKLKEMALHLGSHFKKEIIFEANPALFRPDDKMNVTGDSRLFQQTFSWQSRSRQVDQFIQGFLEDL